VTFASPSETHLDSCGFASSSSVARGLRAKLLSWGFPKISSPPASEPHVHSQVVTHPSARGCQPSCMFRPCRSSRLRRFSPCDPSQVCLTLQPVLRFAPFQTFGVIAPTRLRAVRPTPRSSPAAPCSCTPSRAFPSSSAVPCHHGPCPLTVLNRSQGFSRPTSPLSRPRVTAGTDPLLSWASFPFKVLPHRPACYSDSDQNEFAQRNSQNRRILHSLLLNR